jgi:putative membrane protein
MESALVLADHYHHFGEGGGWWFIFPLLWLALIVGAIIFFGRRVRGGFRQRPFLSGETVLAERYARGEISEDEYRERLSVLKKRPE